MRPPTCHTAHFPSAGMAATIGARHRLDRMKEYHAFILNQTRQHTLTYTKNQAIFFTKVIGACRESPRPGHGKNSSSLGHMTPFAPASPLLASASQRGGSYCTHMLHRPTRRCVWLPLKLGARHLDPFERRHACLQFGQMPSRVLAHQLLIWVWVKDLVPCCTPARMVRRIRVRAAREDPLTHTFPHTDTLSLMRTLNSGSKICANTDLPSRYTKH